MHINVTSILVNMSRAIAALVWKDTGSAGSFNQQVRFERSIVQLDFRNRDKVMSVVYHFHRFDSSIVRWEPVGWQDRRYRRRRDIHRKARPWPRYAHRQKAWAGKFKKNTQYFPASTRPRTDAPVQFNCGFRRGSAALPISRARDRAKRDSAAASSIKWGPRGLSPCVQ
jgi:hypothetical protein